MESHTSSGRKSKANRGQGTCKGTSNSRNGVDLVILDDDCPTELITNPGGVLRKRPSPTAENQRAEWREGPVSPGDNQELNAEPEPDRENPMADVLETGVTEKKLTVMEKFGQLEGELRKKRLRMSECFDDVCAPYVRTLSCIRDGCTRSKLFRKMTSDHLDLISELLHSRGQQDAGNLMQHIHDISKSWSRCLRQMEELGLEEENREESSSSTNS